MQMCDVQLALNSRKALFTANWSPSAQQYLPLLISESLKIPTLPFVQRCLHPQQIIDWIISSAWVVLSELPGGNFIRLSIFLQNVCENKPGEVNSCESWKEKMTSTNKIAASNIFCNFGCTMSSLIVPSLLESFFFIFHFTNTGLESQRRT